MLAWLVPSLFAYIYAVFGGVEFGLPTLRLAAQQIGDQRVIGRWFSPVWEVTNVFLVMAMTSFAAIFPLALAAMPAALRWWLLLVGLILGLRALLVLVIFYGQKDNWLTDWLLASVSLILPAVLAQVVLNLITSQPGLLIAVSAALVAICLSLALSAAFMLGLGRRSNRPIAIAALAGAGLTVWPLLTEPTLAVVASLIIGAVLVGLAVVVTFRWRWTAFLVGAATIALIFLRLLIRQWPYVIYPDLPYDQVAAGPAIHHVILIGLLIGSIIVMPGLIWLGVVLAHEFAA